MFSENQLIDHFRILKKIGSGGMGEVFLAEDTKLGRKVALKMLPQEYTSDPEKLSRFHREAKTAAQINHNNVMSIYDINSFKDEKTNTEIHYLVMEYIEGQELGTFLKNKKLEISEIVKLAEKVASGLSAAHKLNIVHRDIKAENILIDDSGNPKILDFGLAKHIESFFEDETKNTATISRELTKAGKILGTVSYMSPEQARGDEVDTRSDIFSFGILLYRMATSEFPFSGPTHMSTLAKILEVKHETPSSKNQNIPLELEQIIDKCLQKDAQDRYQDTRDLVVDLRSLRRKYDSGVTDSITSQVSAITNKGSKTLILRGKKLGLSIAGLVVLILLVISNVNLNITTTPTEIVAGENSLAILGFENKTGDESLDWLETALPEILLTDLSQSNAVKLVSHERILDYFDDKNASHSFDDFKNAAKSLGSTSMLSGVFLKFGDNIRIDARLVDINTGNIIFAEKVSGKDPFILIDSLSAKIAISLDIKDAIVKNVSVNQFTSSVEAYKLYHEGMKLFIADYQDESIVKFQKAIDIDPNFALPYMRIGMAYVFSNRNNLGVPYFQKAKELEKNLPIREKSLLDIYTDIWLNTEFDDAFTKMKSFVSNYPDDKEGRTIYSMLIDAFKQDTVAAIAQLDTVLAIDKSFQLALSFLSQLREQRLNFEGAIEPAKLIIEYHPDSPEGYNQLADIYAKQNRVDEAIAVDLKAIQLLGDNKKIYEDIHLLYLKKRVFDSSIIFLEKFRSTIENNDPYDLIGYCNYQANLANWQGEFKKGMDFRFDALEYALITGDSNRIGNSYNTIANYYARFDMPDSFNVYVDLMNNYLTDFGAISYPMVVVANDRFRAKEMRPILTQVINNVKKKAPADLWELLDNIQVIFDAYADADTAALIANYNDQIVAQPSNAINNTRALINILANSGKYSETLENFGDFANSNSFTMNAYTHCYYTYLWGIANEGAGNRSEAIENYQEVLKYWGDPELELEEIKDCRARLANLAG